MDSGSLVGIELAVNATRFRRQMLTAEAMVRREEQRQGKPLRRRGRRGQLLSHRVGRNAPCPCGSGRKYKRCCGAL
jgi:uncharacterized protein YecA (UPF0149 family)